MNRRIAITLVALSCLAASTPVHAERILIAVAANFSGTAQRLIGAFEDASGHGAELVSGSTGSS